MSNESKIKQIFTELFDIVDVEDSMTREDIEEWDSLMHIQLVLELEGTFGIKFTTTQIVDMDSVGKIIEIVNEKLN